MKVLQVTDKQQIFNLNREELENLKKTSAKDEIIFIIKFPPRKKCKKCYGRGYTAMRIPTNSPVVCKCTRIKPKGTKSDERIGTS